ncbi:MAG TPA: MFS transporter [Solirubrobacteraceae bacterium]|nr:MFS transporter [Solirubrobacteraceae bacterium]
MRKLGSLLSHRPRPLVVAVHGILLLASATQTALVPLLPELSHLHHLSSTLGAFLIAAPGLATLAISAPAGLIADRFGAKPVTVSATVLLAAGAASQALLTPAALIVGRLMFGLAYGIMWTTATAWLADADPGDNGGRALGAVATSSAAGLAAGPGLGGVMAQLVGLSAPFVLAAVAAGVAVLVLTRQPKGPATPAPARDSLRAMALEAPRYPGIFVGAVALGVVGAVNGVTQLLVPLDLHRAGVSTAATGVVFSIAAIVYVIASGSVTRTRRLFTIGVASGASLILSLSLLPASLDITPAVLVGVLFVSTVPRATISTIAFPLATRSAAEAGIARGSVIGLLNSAWAVGLVLTPLLAGLLAGHGGPGIGFLAAIVPGVLAAFWLISRRHHLHEPALA